MPTGREAALFSKIEGIAARLALLTYLVKSVTAKDFSFSLQVDAESVAAGVVMAEWFAEEALRIYSIFTESPDDSTQRELVEWVEKQSGSTTSARLARQGLRRFRGRREEARTALDALVESGEGRWEDVHPGSAGGRPTRRFVLLRTTTNETAPACVDTEPKPPQASLEDGVSYPATHETDGEVAT